MDLDEFARWHYASRVREPVVLSPDDTVLLLIDVQACITSASLRSDYAERDGVVAPGLDEAFCALDRLNCETLANIGRILDACRVTGIRPIHVKIESLLADAADTGRLHDRVGLHCPPGSAGTAFLAPAIPLEGEIVLRKTCSGVCDGTSLDRILRNLGTRAVVVVGFYTDQCVSSTVRSLADLGYEVCLVSDATAALSRERAVHALESLDKIYAVCETTDQLMGRIASLL